MVILEGPDASGKTTLAHKICERYGFEYCRNPHLSSVEGPTSPKIVDWWIDQLASDDSGNKVYDRCFYISELIYQLAQPERELLTNPTEFSFGLWRVMRKASLVVFCLPPWEAQRTTLQDHNRAALHGVELKMLEKISWAYCAVGTLVREGILDRYLEYDYTEMSPHGVYEAVEDLLEVKAIV